MALRDGMNHRVRCSNQMMLRHGVGWKASSFKGRCWFDVVGKPNNDWTQLGWAAFPAEFSKCILKSNQENRRGIAVVVDWIESRVFRKNIQKNLGSESCKLAIMHVRTLIHWVISKVLHMLSGPTQHSSPPPTTQAHHPTLALIHAHHPAHKPTNHHSCPPPTTQHTSPPPTTQAHHPAFKPTTQHLLATSRPSVKTSFDIHRDQCKWHQHPLVWRV
jgi:hypothetical protein